MVWSSAQIECSPPERLKQLNSQYLAGLTACVFKYHYPLPSHLSLHSFVMLYASYGAAEMAAIPELHPVSVVMSFLGLWSLKNAVSSLGFEKTAIWLQTVMGMIGVGLGIGFHLDYVKIKRWNPFDTARPIERVSGEGRSSLSRSLTLYRPHDLIQSIPRCINSVLVCRMHRFVWDWPVQQAHAWSSREALA
jgi:hypothetical protein